MGSTPNIPSPAVDAFIAYAAQTKLALFVSAGTADPRTLLFGFNGGGAKMDTRDRSLVGRCMLTTLPFTGLF